MKSNEFIREVKIGTEITGKELLYKAAAQAMLAASQEGQDLDYEQAIQKASKIYGIPYQPSELPRLLAQRAEIDRQLDLLRQGKKLAKQRRQAKLAPTPAGAEEYWKTHALPTDRIKPPAKSLEEQLKESLRRGESYSAKVYFKDGTSATLTGIPSLEIDLKQYFAKKGKAVDRVEYDFAPQGGGRGSGPEPHEPGSGSARSARTGEALPEGEGSWKKETPWTKTTGKDPRGKVTHMSDVARRESEKRSQDSDPMNQLFKDFEKIFGKKPPVKEGNVVNINRGGFNAFRDRADWLDKRDYVQQQLLDPRQRDNYPELKQRLLDINSVGRKLGYTHEKDLSEESQDDRNARIIAGEIEDAVSQGDESLAQQKIKKLKQLGYYFDKQGRLQKMGMYEGVMKDLHTDLADKYRELAPKIERHRDSYLAGELYDALEEIAAQHGAMAEFRRMMNGAKNRAHLDYDTNPGGFQNWFWYLPFADEQGVAEAKATKTRLDPKCWSGKKIGNPKTKVKGGVRVNNCVPK
jgi:hypothetical protein